VGQAVAQKARNLQRKQRVIGGIWSCAPLYWST